MPKLFNSAVLKGVILQGSTALGIAKEGTIAVRVTGVPENNIRLLATVHIYDNFSGLEPADFFTLPSYEVRQPRSSFLTPKSYPAGTIVRLIPLYDFAKVELWYAF